MVFRVTEAVIATATQAVETARQLLAMSTLDAGCIIGLGRAAASTLRVLLNDERFKTGNSMTYFTELQERIREIRRSERFFYQKNQRYL